MGPPMRYLRTSPDPQTPPTATPDTEQAWRILFLVNDWIKHAETKLSVALGAAGVTAGVLYNFVLDNRDADLIFMVIAAVCGTSIIFSLTSAMIGLSPVLKLPRANSTEANPLFFGEIASLYTSDFSGYAAALATLSETPGDEMRQLGRQIFVNSAVARRKYRWADRAIHGLMIDVFALSGLTVISVLHM